MKKDLLILLALLLISSQTIYSQTYRVGFGKNIIDNDNVWSTLFMYDDGTNGDLVAGDGIHTRDVTILSPQDIASWWVKNSDNTAIIWPPSSSSWFVTTTDNQVVKFTYNTNSNTEGWIPSGSVGNANDIPIAGEDFYTRIELDGTNVGNQVMYDDGSNGDATANDGIYTCKETLSAIDTYVWYVKRTNWGKPSWSIHGRLTWGSNSPTTITTTSVDQDVYFYLNTNDGRTFVELDTTVSVEPTDTLTSVIGPSSIMQGESITVSVGYEASAERDINCVLQLNEAPWTVYASSTKSVSAGVGSEEFILTIPNDIPEGSNYHYQTIITPIGGSWSNRFDNLSQAPVEVTSDDDGPGVEDSVEGYTLVWSDEFEADVIDPNNWQHEVNASGDFNGAVQYYTDREENSYVSDGKLVIVAKNETYAGPDGTREFTSARLNSQNLAGWKYGKIFVRAKLPKGVGTWPGIWMMPTESFYGSWPKSGEIDIMEHVGFDQNKIHGTVHMNAYNHTLNNGKGSSVVIPGVSEEFHTYSVEWTEDFIEFSVDNNAYYRYTNPNETWEKWPFDQEFYMILNIAIGGGWGGQQGIDTTAFPTQMEIDYVRAYQKSETTSRAHYYVKHGGDGWVSHLMNDEGLNGDKIANDGVHSILLTVDATDNLKIDWVVADSNQATISDISWFYNSTGSQDILFTYDPRTHTDGWLPAAKIPNSQEELGNAFTIVAKSDTDTLKFVSLMTDDGDVSNGDTLSGDKIFSFRTKIPNPGNYKWFVHHNVPPWATGVRWSQYGKTSSWSDTTATDFTTTSLDQNVKFHLNLNTGRVLHAVEAKVNYKKYYIKHAGDSWTQHLMFDDGSNGDKKADDGIYSLLLGIDATHDIKIDWIIADSTGADITETAWLYNPTGSQDILFTYDTNKYTDGWLPTENIFNSQEELGNAFTLIAKSVTDTLKFVSEMTDDGNVDNADEVAGDKIFSLRRAIPNPGNYTWFIHHNVTNWAIQVRWSQFGKKSSWDDTNEIKFSTTEANQAVNFHLDINTGRVTFKVDNPINPPHYKKYYVKHDASWSTTNLMYDDGQYGDIYPNDGVYSRLLTISNAKDWKNDWVITDSVQNQFGHTSWFYNPAETEILFTLDTKTYDDGWVPVTNIKNTNETALLDGPFGVQIDTSIYYGVMTDDGDLANGDSVAGDYIYSFYKSIETVGEHTWFAFFDGGLQRRWDSNGKQNGWEGSNPVSISFTTTIPNQDIYFNLNLITGRLRTLGDSTTVDVKDIEIEIPTEYKLSQNYPNPFNPTTTITYSIPANSANRGSEVTKLKVYNMLGMEVATLVNKKQTPGNYSVQWNGKDNYGNIMSSGIYIYRMQVGNYLMARKMLLLK